MNHIYRLCWNRATEQWVPAPELARSAAPAPLPRKRILGHRAVMLSVLAASLLAAGAAYAGGGPVGGQITSGSGQIQQIGNTTVIHQNSQTLTLNWQSFDIGSNQTVDFVQPGSSSIAVNRIFGNTPSEIYGHLDANGQVWLINPNGILFGQGAQVNVGGLVASTLDVDNDSLLSDTRTFSGSGTGSIVNRGTITAANGGYVALLGNNVSNQGVVSAQLGTVALGGGSAVTLTFSGNQLLHVQVDQSTLDNLVENRELIMANGGQVIMTAGAKNAILASAVNNTGVVQAQTVANHNGVITLLGGMTAGSVNVGGTLDASAPNGGNGGSIETSAAHFNVASGARITATAPRGNAGTWLVDPTNLIIDSTAATAIDNALDGGTSVTETTTANGVTGVAGSTGNTSSGNGDIDVESAISWNTNATLTLNAYNGINITAPITNTAGGGNLTLVANGSVSTTGINIGAQVSTTGSVLMQAVGTTYKGNLTIGTGGSIAGATGVTLATTGNFVNDAGSSAVSSSGGNWLIYSTNPTSDTDDGLTPQFIQYNATYTPTTTAPAVSGENGFLYSYAPTLKVSALTSTVTKVYDGTTTATLAASNFTDSGLYNGDEISSATGTYSQSNVGSNLTVTAPSAITGYSIVNSAGIPVYGYKLSGTPSAAIGSITPAPLTATIVGDPTKTYDGTTTATLSSSNYSISGFVSGQGATVNQPSSVAYAGADAGTQTINATFSVTNFVANSGTLLSNYTLPTTATGTGTITPAQVLLTGVVADNKVYDGTTTDTLNLSNAGLFGVNSNDTGDVTLSQNNPSGTFSQSNVGNNLPVTITSGSFTLTGSKADDYTLILPSDLTANITPLALTVSGLTANNKVYDGTAADTLNTGSAALNGVIGSDQVSLVSSSAGGTFSQSNVGNDLAVTVSGLSLTGAAAGNYTVTAPTGLTADITPAPLTITFNGNPTKTYDGTDAVTLGSSNFNITGFVGTQSAMVSQSAGTYASPNASTNIPITATLQPSDFTPASGTLMSNYSFPASVSGTGTIDPLQLTGAIIGNPTKTYDGTDTATLTSSNLELQGLVQGQSIAVSSGIPLAGGTYASANAGAWGVTYTGSLPANDFTAGSGTLLSNYILPASWIGSGTINPKSLGGGDVLSTSITGVTKVYDGTPTITLTAGDFTPLTGWVGSDGGSLSSSLSVTGTFGQSNVGTNIPISATLTMSDVVANSGTDLNNYTLAAPSTGTGSITPRPLTVTIVGDPTKVYDGSANAALTSANFSISNWASGEGGSINPTASAQYNTADVTANTVTATLAPGNYVPNSNTLLSNYTLVYSASGPGTITPAPLYVTNVYANNKVYDSTNAATLTTGSAGLSGLVSSDNGDVSLSISNTGTFAQSNAGNGIAVTPSAISISGSAAQNYTLQPLGLTADITPAPLTISGVTANSKVYDGTTSDTLNTGAATLVGVYGSDANQVTLDSSDAQGTFSQSNVGNNLGVTASGFTLGGAQDGNYYLQQPTGLTADITPKQLTVSISGDPSKVYDGSTSATLTASDYTITGFVTVNGVTQSATLPQSATANYNSPNAGTDVGISSTLVTSDWVAGANTLLSNYILPTAASGTLGTITPYVLNLNGTRVYDTTTNAYGSDFGTLVGLNGDEFTLGGEGVVSNKDVGTYTGTGGAANASPYFDLSTLGLVASGTQAGKTGTDIASNYTLVGGTDKYTITPATLYVTGTTVAPKTYNGKTNDAALSGSVLNGVLGSDNVTLGGDTTGKYGNSGNAGTDSVSTNMTISGADKGNYILEQPQGLTGIVNPAVINLTGLRQYDGTTNVDGSVFGTVAGVDGQTLTLSGTGTTSSANASTTPYTGIGGSTTNPSPYFNLGSLTLVGNSSSLAKNYTLIGGTDSLTITPYQISLIGTRIYDAGTDGNASLFGTACAIASDTCAIISGVNGETLELTGSGISSSKNAHYTYTGIGGSTTGTSPYFNLGTLQLVAGGTGSLSNYTLVGGTDKLTITPAPLTITGTTVDTKTYDGNTTATLGGTQVLHGVLGTDDVTIATDIGNFSSPNVGTWSVTSSITLGGTDEGNYTLTQPAGLTGTIVQALITLTGTRQYDGTTDANSTDFGNNGVIQTGVNGETLTLTGDGLVSGANSPNVGTYTQAGSTFNLGSLALNNGSGLASNYEFNTTGSTFTITPKVISLTGTRAYDTTTDGDASLFNNGTACATASATCTIISTGIGNETIELSGVGVSSSANVATYTGTGGSTTGTSPYFNLGTLTLVAGGTGSLSNYTLVGGTDTLQITPYTITLAGTRQYDGQNDAGASAFLNSNGVITGLNGQTLTLSGAGTATGSNASTTPYKLSSLGTLALNNGTGLASNYALAPASSDTLTITPYAIDLSSSRQYDGTENADASLFGNNGQITGVDGQTLTLSGTGTTSSANASTTPYTGIGSSTGTSQGFNLNTLTLTGNGPALSSNYTLIGGTDSLTITPYVLNLSGTRVYDAGTDANASAFGNDGVISTGIGNQTVTLTGAGTVSNKDVGLYSTSNTGTNTLDPTGLGLSDGSGLASNYTLVGGTDTLQITPALLYVTGTTVNTATYSGGTTATLSGATLTNGTATGDLLGNDQVTLGNDTTGTFASPNAGTNIPVSTSMTISGTDAGNYTLVQPTGLTGTIDPYVLNLTGTRVYDGNTDANGNLFGTLAGLNGDTLTVSGSGVLSSKNVGTYDNGSATQNFGLGTLQLVSGGGSTLASNYTLVGGTDIFSVTPLAITVDATTNNKTYDSTTSATLSNLYSNGVLAGDNVTFSDTGAAFVSPNVGNGVQVDVTGITANGADAGNYTINTSTTTTANITPAIINLSGTRVYDGQTDADASLFGNNGVVTGVAGQTLNLSGIGSVASKNVGTYTGSSQFNLGGLALSDGTGLASNYTLIGGTDTLSITPLVITVDATGNDKVYDGSTAATVDLGSNGILAGDQVSFSDGSANFSTSNAGNGISIAVSGITGSGADAGNYIFNTTATTSANITPAVINLSGTRVYDGQTDANANVFGNNGVVAGVAGQTLNLSGSGSVASKNVGTYTGSGQFNLGGLTLADGTGLASNYTLIGGTDTLSITPLSITVDAAGTSRPYNGTTGDIVTLSSAGVLGGDQIGFAYTAANFDNPYVGNGKPVTVTGITLTGADSGNYVVADPTALTYANITGTGYTGTGISGSWIAQLQSTLYPTAVATPYGSAASDTVGVYIGNHKLQHKPIERNRIRSDFHSGFPLQVNGDGVRLPLDASP